MTAEVPALRNRRRTQSIGLDLHSQRHAGLRWWSAFRGECHSLILFHDRLAAGALTYGQPAPLDVTSASVMDAVALLDIG